VSLRKTKYFAEIIRKNIIYTAYHSGGKSAHLGGALSIADILAVLFGSIMNINAKKPLNENRDRFILSKGHACLALYSALVEKGFFSKDKLKYFERPESFLLGHPIINKKMGIEFSTGSLGMGLSLGIGLAIAAQKKKLNYLTYVIIGDGECNEGSIWEAAILATHLKLNNLVAILDKNNFQQTGNTKEILDLGNINKKWQYFNWDVKEIDGHNHKEIHNALNKKIKTSKPRIIIANTTKGKGFNFSENNNQWHHGILSKEKYDEAMSQIK
jgi:transketolase